VPKRFRSFFNNTEEVKRLARESGPIARAVV
jgi:hypothetical protein